MSSFKDDAILSASSEQLCSRMGDEMAILDLRSGTYFGLNPVAARVWELVQQAKTIGAIRVALLNEFNVQADVLEQDLIALFEAMQAQGLLHPASAA